VVKVADPLAGHSAAAPGAAEDNKSARRRAGEGSEQQPGRGCEGGAQQHSGRSKKRSKPPNLRKSRLRQGRLLTRRLFGWKIFIEDNYDQNSFKNGWRYLMWITLEAGIERRYLRYLRIT
jgi:hypothetical protein